MKNNFKFILELVKFRLSHIMTFRMGFFAPFFINTSYFLVQLFAFEAIYGHVDNIRGWGHGEILIFIGTFSLIDSLNMIICFLGVVIVCIFTFFALSFWIYGIHRYESASS